MMRENLFQKRSQPAGSISHFNNGTPLYPEQFADLMPREKLVRSGVQSLSDEMLVALLIGSGTSKKGVKELSREVLRLLDESTAEVGLPDLFAIQGMGLARASRILAALEFSRRRLTPSGKRITGPSDVYDVVNHYSDRKQEHFLSLSLNGAGELIRHRVISVGLVNQTQVHPREVFAPSITDRASAIILAHNHPSGRTEPSQEDIHVTERMIQSGATLGIQVLDHVIFSVRGYQSLRESQDHPGLFSGIVNH